MLLGGNASAQTADSTVVRTTRDSIQAIKEQQIKEVNIVGNQSGMLRMRGPINGMIMNKEELFKAACCNLGESFVNNPTVDVKYDDATTGAKQVKLLGLSGTYVQMLTENIPNFRGAALPYALGYVPGPWMKSIQVSTGLASVKNGYESITGQINVQYLQPEDEEGLTINLYGNTKSRIEANADGNWHITPKLSSELLVHYDDNLGNHDDNGDGFLDQAKVRQLNLQNRWAYFGKRYIFHGGISTIQEKRTGGQVSHHNAAQTPLFKIGINTERYEGYMKHAFLINPEHQTNVALIATTSLHKQDALFGNKSYDVAYSNAYLQAIFETNLNKLHHLSTGLSLNHDNYDETLQQTKMLTYETTPGIFAQYTYNKNDKLTAMVGIRADYSSKYGAFVTPRLHLKWQISNLVGIRLSAGKGYRTVNALAENHYLLASGRTLTIEDLEQEAAWNYGVTASWYIPMANKTLKLNTSYYYTDFEKQAIVDYDTNPQQIIIHNLHGKSYSHTFQIDASYPVLPGLTVNAAYRYNDVKTTYNGVLMRKPLTSKYKGLLSASYKTPLGLWQFDANLQINGGGRMPTPVVNSNGKPEWDSTFPTFYQLSAQVTRWFRHFSVYVGGENLTGYQQKNPILHAEHPWSPSFEPTLIWGPIHGAMLYAGVRINIGRL